jgi:diguanylate cyclase
MSEARTDMLTNLPNRRVFDDELTRRISEFCRYGSSVCVVLLDIDRFKRFNDRYGHLAGDAVLVHVGNVLRESVREIDLVARLGGEEFVLLLPNSTRPDAWQAAERVRTAVEQSICTYEGQSLQVTVSGGAAQLVDGEDAKGVVNRADQALYASKSAGRNCAHWHDGKESLPITPGRAVTQPAVTQPAVAQPTARESAQPAARARRKEEFSQVCEELRRKLHDVVSQHA